MQNPPENTVLLNICVIPSPPVGDRCIEISQTLSKQKTLFLLDGDTKFAHMTIFMARFPIASIDSVKAAVEACLATFRSFECVHSGYFMTEGRYLEVSYRKSSPFLQLHESLIEAVSKLRANPGNPYEEGYFTPYTKDQQKNAQETGYDLAYELYRPHITLTRYAENAAIKEFPALPAANLSFDLDSVCIYKADDNGAVYEKLASFNIT